MVRSHYIYFNVLKKTEIIWGIKMLSKSWRFQRSLQVLIDFRCLLLQVDRKLFIESVERFNVNRLLEGHDQRKFVMSGKNIVKIEKKYKTNREYYREKERILSIILNWEEF